MKTSLAIFIAALQLVSGPSARAEDRGPVCVALAIYAEARGESLAGQAAVGQVVLNRLKRLPIGSDACDVVLAPGQFEGVDKWKYPRVPHEADAWELAWKIAVMLSTSEYSVPPPIGNAVYFRSNGSPSNLGKFLGAIGNHSFYGDDRWGGHSQGQPNSLQSAP